jgi:sugar lactone lactonase YvrE
MRLIPSAFTPAAALIGAILLVTPSFAQVPRLATKTGLSGITSLVLDDNGNLYFAEVNEHRVSKVTPTGELVVIAGTGKSGFKGDGGRAVAAQLDSPRYVTVDGNGIVYITDTGNYRVRRVGTDGVISTIAGTGKKVPPRRPTDKRPAIADTVAALGHTMWPGGLAVDASGQLYIEHDGRISRLQDGNLTRLNEDAVGKTLALARGALGRDAAGNHWTTQMLHEQTKPGRAAFRNVVIRTSPGGEETVVAGNGNRGGGGPGKEAVEATSVGLINPLGVAVGLDGTAYISDRNHMALRKLTPDGKLSTVYGNPSLEVPLGSFTYLVTEAAIAIDKAGHVYFATPDPASDFGFRGVVYAISAGHLMLTTEAGEPVTLSNRAANSRIVKIAPDGTVTPFAGR